MEMNNIPEMFQSKLRLMIVSGLIKGPLSFVALKQLTGATDGNLSVQISKLSDAGYITVRKEFSGKKPLTTCELTQFGRDSFREYVELLNSIIAGNNPERPL